MPYASDAQRRFMHVRHPKIARRWDAEVRSAKKKGSYVKPPPRVEPVAKQFGANNAVGKGLPAGLSRVAAKYGSEPAMRPDRKIAYAHERLAAHTAGRSVTAAYPYDVNERISRGVRARRRSKLVAVTKALNPDDKRTLTAAGVAAGGVGLTKIGGAMHHAAVTSVPKAAATVTARQAALRSAIAERDRTTGQPRPIGGAAGLRKILKEPGQRPRNPLNRKDQIKNLQRGVEEAQAHHASTLLGQHAAIRRAVKTKLGGLGIAAGGAYATGHYFHQASRNRQAAAGYGLPGQA